MNLNFALVFQPSVFATLSVMYPLISMGFILLLHIPHTRLVFEVVDVQQDRGLGERGQSSDTTSLMYFLFASRSSFSVSLMSRFCSLMESANSIRVCSLAMQVSSGSLPNMPRIESFTIFSMASFTARLSESIQYDCFHNI